MAAHSNNALTEAPRPDERVRKNTSVIVISALVMLVLVLVGLFAGILPLVSHISDSNKEREAAVARASILEAQRVELERMRGNIVEQYDAIQLFAERYPSAAEQDTLFRDLQNSALFAGTNIDSIATDYPQLLSAENLEEGSIIRPDQIVLGSAPDASADPVVPVVGAAPGTDVEPGDKDSYPLGTIPLSVNATLDGTQVFVDNVGTHYVASPYLGYYSYGGDSGRERLSMQVAVDTTPTAIRDAYFAESVSATTGWSTVFAPDESLPPYRDLADDIAALDTAELVAMYPKATAVDTVSVPPEWASNNGYVRLSDVSQAALLIDEIQQSPGRAILLRFVSGSGTQIVLSGQQFILRELPPLPESIFGDLNKDGVIEDGPAPSSAPSPSTPAEATLAAEEKP